MSSRSRAYVICYEGLACAGLTNRFSAIIPHVPTLASPTERDTRIRSRTLTCCGGVCARGPAVGRRARACVGPAREAVGACRKGCCSGRGVDAGPGGAGMTTAGFRNAARGVEAALNLAAATASSIVRVSSAPPCSSPHRRTNESGVGNGEISMPKACASSMGPSTRLISSAGRATRRTANRLRLCMLLPRNVELF